MRPRATLAAVFFFASAFAAYACSSTFPSALPVYNGDSGPQPSYDSAVPSDAPPGEGGLSEAGDSATEAGEAGSTDGGHDGSSGDASDASTDGGDSGSLDSGDAAG